MTGIICAALFDRIVNPELMIRRLTLAAGHVVGETEAREAEEYEQLELFGEPPEAAARQEQEEARQEREKKWQKAMLEIQKKYGKNAVLRGMSLEEGATARERNEQIGGHKA